MKSLGLIGATLITGTLTLAAFGCTHTVVQDPITDDDAGTTLPSGGGKKKGSSSSSSSSSSGGSSSGGSSSGGSSSGGSSSGGSSSGGSSSGGSSSGGSSSGGSSSGGSSSGGSSNGGAATCPTTTPISPASLPWAPPTPTQAGACTAADIAALDSYIDANPAATFADWDAFLTARSATCRACLVADAANPTWAPFPTAAGDLATINVGGCYALVSGVPACGKSIQNLFDCRLEACGDCMDEASFETCLQTAASGPACKPIADSIAVNCAGAPADIDDICQPATATYLFDGPAAKQCVGP